MRLLGYLKQSPASVLIILILISGSVFAFLRNEIEVTLALALATILSLVLILLALKSKDVSKEPRVQEKMPTTDATSTQALASCEQHLKDVQEQLINQEKLASVGMLSAGIAHEIKNPLNFINNFADMTVELLDELKEEVNEPLTKVDEETKEAINSTIEDIVVNCKKINEHGKRAESIIKNMLMQARSSNVEKAPLNVNGLLEEYLNLSYHGMRAQNIKSNVKIEKYLDPNLPLVTVNQQSIGRVFLNIINNGLYAANEKVEKENSSFMPTITISSEQDAQNVIIKIKDNGSGIPESIRKKIFEPFFTTKPVGHGTGLGLPLCYDIVVKEHGGQLDVNSSAGEFTEFIIKIPKDKST